jgi:hypothetical protein
MLGEVVAEPQGLLERLAAGGLVPLVLEQVGAAHHPPRRGVRGSEHAAEPAAGDQLQPAGVVARDVHEGRHAGAEQLAVGGLRTGQLALVVRPVGARALEEARHVHLGHTVLLADAAIAGLEARVEWTSIRPGMTMRPRPSMVSSARPE